MTPSDSYRPGDRVIVHPLSTALKYLDGQPGTVEKQLPDDGSVLTGAVYVQMDCDGETLGISPERIERA